MLYLNIWLRKSHMPRAILKILALSYLLPFAILQPGFAGAQAFPGQLNEDEINLFCLKHSYPAVRGIEKDNAGRAWLVLENGKKALYEDPFQDYGNSLDVDIKTAMSQPYPLEPSRPPTPPGLAPGRKRPYEFLAALYGGDARTIKGNLEKQRLLGKNIALAPAASAALARALPRLARIAENPADRPLLKPDGGFYWRKIAGEPYLSAHSFGIAFDLGASRAPYWRWSRRQSHPMQQSYPGEIVSELESQGFIWGGKWHEYDLMHFEYRPEIICKARLLKEARQ